MRCVCVWVEGDVGLGSVYFEGEGVLLFISLLMDIVISSVLTETILLLESLDNLPK